MPSSIRRAPAPKKKQPTGWILDEKASSAILAIGGIGTLTFGGLLAWFIVGSVMMTMPGIIGVMGFVAAVTALVLTIMIVTNRGG